MFCDKCKKDIIEDVDDTTSVYLICFNEILYWFCSSECRQSFIDSISIDAYADRGGHIVFKEAKDDKAKRS